MSKKNWYILAAFSVLMLVTLACGFSASTANIKDAFLASDSEGNNKVTSFGQGDTFYCIVELANAPSDTAVKAIWYAVEAQGVDPNKQINETNITNGSGTLYFKLSNDQNWPVGKYKVEIYLNGTLDKTLEFEVQ